MNRTQLLVMLFFSNFAVAPAALAQFPRGMVWNHTGRLTGNEPFDKVMKASYCTILPNKLDKENTYLFDLRSRDFDAYLRIEDKSGKQLAADNDSGGGRNARIIFTPPRTEDYRIIVTSFNGGAKGDFKLSVWSTVAAPMPGSTRADARNDNNEDIAIAPALGDNMDSNVGLTTMLSTGNIEAHGYVEYRYVVVNHSPTASHVVTLSVPREGSQGSSQGYPLRALKRTVHMKPTSVETISLFQPNLPLVYGLAGVTIDGRLSKVRTPNLSIQQHRGSFTTRGFAHPPNSNFVPRYILTTTELHNTLHNNAFKSGLPNANAPPVVGFAPLGIVNGGHNNKNYTYVVSAIFQGDNKPVPLWSRHWLGYSSHDGVVLDASELEGAPPEVKAALWQFVECGGSLLIAGSYSVPRDWERTRVRRDKLTSYFPGFGQCIVAADWDVNRWEPEEWQPIAAMWEQSAKPWTQVTTPDQANRRFSIVESRGIPVRGLFLVMLVFAILIGPVNIYLLTRKKRRIWLLWTVPVFSLLTCLAVVAYMTLSEGWETHVRVQGVTILDERAERAVSAGWLGIYAPITPGDGLHFIEAAPGQGTELTPHLKSSRPLFSQSAKRVIDWSTDQNLSTGWVTARVPAQFLVRTSEQRPEHIVLDNDRNGGLRLVNKLGADINAIWLANDAGKIYTASAVAAGGTGELTLTTKKTAGQENSVRQVFAGDWLAMVDYLATNPEDYLRPGCYIAVMEVSPFLETGLRHATTKGRSVVCGIMKTP
jgi:hypothetical protein